MNATQHQNIVGFIWNIANKLRGPYRPPQYRRVMLPLVVLQEADIAAGQTQQLSILAALAKLDPERLYRKRLEFEQDLKHALQDAGVVPSAPVMKLVLAALGERDPKADICRDAKGKPEPDAELRDTEIVPLPKNIPLPLPLGYDNETGHDNLLKLVKKPCEDYLKAEVLPHVPDAWIAHDKTKVGYEIPLTRHFYVYEPPRPLEKIEAEIKALEADIVAMLSEVV